MSKGLEALEKICNKGCDYCDKWHCENNLFCKHELGGCSKCVFCGEEHNIIEKELKALEIIKRYFYGNGVLFGEMTKEEFDLLKEVLL